MKIINKTKSTLVGHINLGEMVDVTDPCYNANTWCRSKINNVFPGKYACYAILSNEGDWGECVSKARIVLDDGSNVAKDTQSRIIIGRSWRRVANIGVDAGLAGFFADKPDFNDEQWHQLCNWMFGDENKNFYIKRFDNDTDGFWTSSGYGDGCYDVYAIRNLVKGKLKITALEIRFI